MAVNENSKILQKSKYLSLIGLEIEKSSAKEVGALSFHPQAFIRTILPHSKQKGNTYKVKYKDYELFISSSESIPYGNIPRLLLNFVATEALRTNSREIDIGENLSQFMKKINLSTDGKTMKRFKNQADALFSANISLKIKRANGDTKLNLNIASVYDTWWTATKNKSKQSNLFPSRLILSQEFFELIREKNTPTDTRALAALKSSSLALDLYIFLTYRYFYLDKRVFIDWKSLMDQFGRGYENNKSGRQGFKKNVKTAMTKIKAVYKTANFNIEKDGLVLFPSPTHIPKKDTKYISKK